ncbi:hypothetical protein [Ligilactobacillus salivarius]|nr:hypothetical protein [Ligilactobacillus salivarius]MDM8284957.1 hypothetical protein [Ligilactobacillus salivarius]
MQLEETKYIKVRDAEVGETGWAYISNGSYVLILKESHTVVY